MKKSIAGRFIASERLDISILNYTIISHDLKIREDYSHQLVKRYNSLKEERKRLSHLSKRQADSLVTHLSTAVRIKRNNICLVIEINVDIQLILSKNLYFLLLDRQKPTL